MSVILWMKGITDLCSLWNWSSMWSTAQNTYCFMRAHLAAWNMHVPTVWSPTGQSYCGACVCLCVWVKMSVRDSLNWKQIFISNWIHFSKQKITFFCGFFLTVAESTWRPHPSNLQHLHRLFFWISSLKMKFIGV